MSLRRKMATWGGGSDGEVKGRTVRQLGWEQVPLTVVPSGSTSDFLGTKRPQLGSWIKRMWAEVVSRREMSASGCRFMLADRIMRLCCIELRG